GNSVNLRINLGVFYRRRNIFYSHDLFSIFSYKVGDSARTGIEVVHQLITLKVCKLSRYFIKLVSLLRISLIKGLRSNLKFKSFHLLEDIISSLIHIYFLVKDGVVPFLVDDIEQRGDGRKL